MKFITENNYMKTKQILGMAALLGVSLSSCKKEGCTDPKANNYNEEARKDDGSCTYDPVMTVPSTYVFTDDAGNNTVSFTGQQQRLDMLSEMTTYMKTGNTTGTTLSATQLKNMYANNGFTWVDANSLGMTGSSKQLENKTAGGDGTIIAIFQGYMDSLANASTASGAGSAGTAGVVTSNSGTKQYLFDAQGYEYTQLIEKGLMGAVFYYNISSHYLSSAQIDVDNASPVDAAGGKHYTLMEHHWDEAYGYFTSEIDYPTNGTDRFWGKYANSRESLLGSATKIATAFRTGRAAISFGDMTERNAQIAIINTEMERMIAGTAIHYLNGAASDITDDALRNHQLSEAVAFIGGLAYGANPSITTTQINSILSTIGTDFYSVSASDLTSARDQLSTIFNMDDIKTVL